MCDQRHNDTKNLCVYTLFRILVPQLQDHSPEITLDAWVVRVRPRFSILDITGSGDLGEV